MKIEDLVLIAGVAGLVFIAAGFFSRRAQAAAAAVGSGVPVSGLPPGRVAGSYDPAVVFAGEQWRDFWV